MRTVSLTNQLTADTCHKQQQQTRTVTHALVSIPTRPRRKSTPHPCLYPQHPCSPSHAPTAPIPLQGRACSSCMAATLLASASCRTLWRSLPLILPQNPIMACFA